MQSGGAYLGGLLRLVDEEAAGRSSEMSSTRSPSLNLAKSVEA